MLMYVVNPTSQNQTILYRLDFNKDGVRLEGSRFSGAKRQDVPKGKQVQFGSDMHLTQINDIIDQLSHYGMISEVEAVKGTFQVTGPVMQIYNIDKPVSQEAVDIIVAHNMGNLLEAGRIRRKVAAVSTGNILGTNDFQISIEQETPGEDGQTPIAEVIELDGPDTEHRSAVRGRRV